MKKILISLIVFCFLNINLNAQSQCVLNCYQILDAAKSKAENDKEHCRRECYIAMAWMMSTILLLDDRTITISPERNEVLSSSEYQDCAGDCAVLAYIEVEDAQMNCADCLGNCTD